MGNLGTQGRVTYNLLLSLVNFIIWRRWVHNQIHNIIKNCDQRFIPGRFPHMQVTGAWTCVLVAKGKVSHYK